MEYHDEIGRKIHKVKSSNKSVPFEMLIDCYCVGPLLQGRSVNEMLVDVATKYGYTVTKEGV